ncbi:MAG: VWA domain-containing protein [Acidobacteriota bacterium]|nr:VWA domain-containing protein [Acidobacteriota bacterium]
MNIPARNRERGVAIYVAAVILVMAVPLIGLAVDGTMLYIIKCRLQGAVDGAALAAAKALSRGNDDSAQKDAATTAAATFVKLNYPSTYFFSNDVVVNTNTDVIIDLSVAHQRTVTVNAHVNAPVLFMRFLNFSSTNVNASATTVRKDSNIVLVLDRSGSMTASGSCGPMKQAAINFINSFAETRDYIGVVTFSTSAYANFPISTNNFKSQTSTIINSMVCDGSTSSAAGLWLGYDQLVGLNQPAALNFIVFFTDGEPTGSAVDMPLTAGSGCTQGTSHGAGNPKTLRGLYATYTNGSAFIGLANHLPLLKADGVTQDFSSGDNYIASNSAGCAFAPGWNSNWQNTSDFQGIPTTDIYGNSLNTSYKAVTLSSGYIDIGNSNNGIPAATNSADDAARRIRIGTVDNYPNAYNRGLTGVIIDSVGLGNAPVPLPADGVFLERVSNDPRSPIYDSTKPAGLFVFAQQSTDIGAAFGEIASEILRISR